MKLRGNIINTPKINELDKIFQLVNRNNICIYFKRAVAPNNTASTVANKLQTNTEFVRVWCSRKLLFMVLVWITRLLRNFAVFRPCYMQSQSTINSIVTFFRTSVYFVSGNPMCRHASVTFSTFSVCSICSHRENPPFISTKTLIWVFGQTRFSGVIRFHCMW